MIVAGAVLLVANSAVATEGKDRINPFVSQRVDIRTVPSDPVALLIQPSATPEIVIDPIKQKENAEAIKPTPSPKPKPKAKAKPVTKPKEVGNVTATPAPVAQDKILKSVAPSGVKDPSWFAFGNCTRYAATRFPVTWSGDAGQWATNAGRQGYTVDKIPEAGALLITRESRRGHVAYIESVNGDVMSIAEMNYAGFNKISRRTISIHNGVIKGVIHRK